MLPIYSKTDFYWQWWGAHRRSVFKKISHFILMFWGFLPENVKCIRSVVDRYHCLHFCVLLLKSDYILKLMPCHWLLYVVHVKVIYSISYYKCNFHSLNWVSEKDPGIFTGSIVPSLYKCEVNIFLFYFSVVGSMKWTTLIWLWLKVDSHMV